MLSLLAVGLWHSERYSLAFASFLLLVNTPLYVFTEDNFFGYLHYDQRWQAGSWEAFQKETAANTRTILMITVPAAILVGIATIREYRRQRQQEKTKS